MARSQPKVCKKCRKSAYTSFEAAETAMLRLMNSSRFVPTPMQQLEVYHCRHRVHFWHYGHIRINPNPKEPQP